MGIQKGVVVLLFFLLIVITMAGFIDLPNLFTETKIEVLDNYGRQARVDIQVIKENVIREDEVLYKKFSVSFVELPDQILQIDVENDWLNYYQIETGELKMRKITSDGSQNLNSTSKLYAATTLVEVKPALSGVYELYGPKKVLN